MLSNRFVPACLALIVVFSHIHGWSWFDGVKRYNGSVKLHNKSFNGDVEFNGASTLSNSKIAGNAEFNGASKLLTVAVEHNLVAHGSMACDNLSVGGSTLISGALKSTNCKFKDLESTALDITNSSVSGLLQVKGNLNSVGSTLENVIARADKSVTYRLTSSSCKDLMIQGAGQKIVILINSTAQTITFEQPGGKVTLIGNSTVKDVVNGTVQRPSKPN